MNSDKKYRYGMTFIDGEQRYFRIKASSITTENPLEEPMSEDSRVKELTKKEFEEELMNE